MAGSGTGTPITSIIGGMSLDDYYTEIKRRTRDWGELNWDETMMKSYINQGYLDFVYRSHCLKKNGSIALAVKTSTFSLPTDVITVYRYEFNQSAIPVYTEDYLDDTLGVSWRNNEGDDVQCVLQSLTGYNVVRIYPIFIDFSSVSYDINESHDYLVMSYDGGTATTVTIGDGCYSGTDLATQMQDDINTAFTSSCTVSYSNTTGIFTFNASTGHTFSITKSGSTIADRIGVLADISTSQSITTSVSVRLWMDYIYKPTELAADGDEPAIAEEYHVALLYYALWKLLESQVGKQREVDMALFYRDEYYKAVVAAKCNSYTYARQTNQQVTGRRWL